MDITEMDYPVVPNATGTERDLTLSANLPTCHVYCIRAKTSGVSLS